MPRGDAFQGYSWIARGSRDSLEQLHITSSFWRRRCGFAKELDSEGRHNPWAHDPNPVLYSAEGLLLELTHIPTVNRECVFSVSPEKCG